MTLKIKIDRHELPAFEKIWTETNYFDFHDYKKKPTAHGYEIEIQTNGAEAIDLFNLGRNLEKQIAQEPTGNNI